MKQENDEVGWMKCTQMLMFRILPKVKNTNACFKEKVSNKIKESITSLYEYKYAEIHTYGIC